jgi:hypothetical protein
MKIKYSFKILVSLITLASLSSFKMADNNTASEPIINWSFIPFAGKGTPSQDLYLIWSAERACSCGQNNLLRTNNPNEKNSQRAGCFTIRFFCECKWTKNDQCRF